ncbi:unnamed protein product [Polarella glacialis]|uniref:Uncharacterized protein n=1 Tax=Polarella glacialis TaxID=89957 RepID=A0A813E3N1_POLGL|nr:unnamed protein product [Polarella glacialis]CAE8609640.1 unnamed protein product [Polarella glacialis]
MPSTPGGAEMTCSAGHSPSSFQVAAQQRLVSGGGPERWKLTREYLCDNRSTLLWLLTFCISGITIGMSFELLDAHAGPAKDATFFVCFIGYVAQFIVSGGYALWTGTQGKGQWTWPMMAALAGSAACDGAAQALNYVARAGSPIIMRLSLYEPAE